MKEKVTFSIDTEIMELARENIPNMSKFIENCLKNYLMISGLNEEARGEQLRKAWETFRNSQLEIHLLTSIDIEKTTITKMHKKVKTDAWLNVWRDYRTTGNTQNHKITESSKILGITIQELTKTLEETYAESRSNMKNLYIYDNWEYIEENILPTITIYEDEDEGDLDDLLSGKVDLD